MNAKILLVFFLGSLLAISQESMDELSLSALMDIQVTTVSKKAEKISQAPSNISVVTARQIKEWGVRDIKDLLKRMTGWPVIPDRDEWVFAVRGNVSDNNAKYLILLDGHRLNSIENFGPGQIIEMPNNLASVKRVEIIRGPGSAVWGPDALAGVVNIITKDAADIVSQGGDGNQNESQSGSQVAINPGLGFDDLSDGTTTLHNGGTFDFQTARLSGDAEVVFFASGGYSEGETVSQAKSAGFAAATDRKVAIAGGLPSDSATYPGYYETLLEKHRPGFMLQSKAKLGGLSINALSFSTETFNRHYESPLGRENYLTTYKGFVEGSYVVQPNSDQMLTFKLSTGINRAEYQPFADPTNLTNMVNIVWLDRQLMAGVDYNVSLYDNLNIGAGLDYTLTKTGPNQRLNKFNINITADSASKSANSVGYWFDPLLEDQQIGGYLQGKYSPIEKVNLVLGGRFDYNDDRGSDPTNINPRAAVIVTPSSSTAIKLLYNRGYLRPANFQSAFVKDSVKSETMDQVDLVWFQEFLGLQSNLTLFWQQLDGFINLFPGSSYNFRNTANYHSQGLEWELSKALGSHEIWGNGYYTLAEASDFDTTMAYNNRRVDLDGRLLSYSPWGGNLGSTLRFAEGKYYTSPHVRIAGPAKYRLAEVKRPALDNEMYYAETNTMIYLNLSLGYEPIRSLSLSLYIDNLLNLTGPVPMTVWNGTIEQQGIELSGRIAYRF